MNLLLSDKDDDLVKLSFERKIQKVVLGAYFKEIFEC